MSSSMMAGRDVCRLVLSLLLLLLAPVAAQLQYNFSTVTGYFLQDVAGTNASAFDFTATNFGLINQTYPSDAAFDPAGVKSQWERFYNVIEGLNAAAPAGSLYRLFFFGRHGDGIHNDAESYYGTPAWNCYWAELDGNGTAVWADAHLSGLGVTQAQAVNTFWAHQTAVSGMHLPAIYYTSPLSRCLATANLTFGSFYTPFAPTVKELFREGISIHTCDRRSNRSYIAASFPAYAIEPGFADLDPLWEGYAGETSAAQDMRSASVMTSIVPALVASNSSSNSSISITSHSGEIASILRVLAHQPFSLTTGAVIPVLVRIDPLASTSPPSTSAPWTTAQTCTVPPLTSLATGGCICPTSSSYPLSNISSTAILTRGIITITPSPTATSVYSNAAAAAAAVPSSPWYPLPSLPSWFLVSWIGVFAALRVRVF